VLRALLIGLALAAALPAPAGAVAVGSKAFTEGIVLGEILAATLADAGFPARHRAGLGGTRIVYEALRRGQIDAYVDYSGTVAEEILAGRHRDPAAIRAALRRDGIGMSAPLGFENTYALAMRGDVAARLGVARVSELAAHPGLRFGFSNEFLERRDGWPVLRQRYALPQPARGMEHELAYRAVASGAVDVTDVYTTDANIAAYGLTLLEDDRSAFPDYHAVILYRLDLPAAAVAALRGLEGRIDAAAMRAMNGRVALEGAAERDVAAAFLHRDVAAPPDGLARRLARTTAEHLTLVALSLSAAIVVAVPLGVLAFRRPRAGQVVLAATGVAQTIPSLALFVLLIPLMGIGGPPAVTALFLYSLLPIVRNTHAGLAGIPPPLRESAEALGLPPRAILRRIELPLAARSILAGIKTAAVINVGTATLGALIGAGGYGQPILTGIRLDDTGLILEGAVPAALLALATQGVFELLERAVVPRGLRLPRPAADA
jgi:osmoprotectant transport system permease protein